MVVEEVSARRLEDYLRQWSSITFKWGITDCVTFTSEWIKKNTGRDLLLDWPKWNNKTQALKILSKAGGLLAAVTSTLGPPSKTFRDGNVAYAGHPYNCMGIVIGPHVAVLTENHGLTLVDLADAKATWNI